MNTNELADKLEGYGVVYVKFEYRKQAATMLRDQHLRIQQLEQTQEYLFKTHDADKAQLKAAEQLVIDAVDRGKSLGYAEGLRKAQEK